MVHSSKLQVIRNIVGIIKEIMSFLSKSNKKKIALSDALELSVGHEKQGKLNSLCETRWVERVTALDKFAAYYVPVVRALMGIS